MTDFCVRIMDLPPSVKGVLQFDETGFANIYINAHMSSDEQKKALKHELEHLKRNDAYNTDSISAIEERMS